MGRASQIRKCRRRPAVPLERRNHSETPSDEPSGTADPNERPDIRENPCTTDSTQSDDATQTHETTRDGDTHGIDAQIATAYRDILEHSPTEEEMRSRDIILDQLDAELPPTDTSDHSPDHTKTTADLPGFHVEDPTRDDAEPQPSTWLEKDGNHPDAPSEDNIARPAEDSAERETRSNLENRKRTPPEECTSVPIDARREQTQSSQLLPIRDEATLDAALDEHPHLRDRPDFANLRTDCDTYFAVLSHRDALTRGDTTIVAIANAVGTYPDQVRRWLTGDQQPRLLWLLDFDRTTATARHDLEASDSTRGTPTDAILRATRDPTYREQLLQPHTFTPEGVDRLLALRTPSDDSKSLDPTAFTHITELATYEQALRAFPFIQEHPRFDTLHRQAQLYFRMRDSPPQRTDGRLPMTALSDYAGMTRITLRRWVTNEKRPHLLILLEERAATLKDYQDRVATLRDLDGGITTIHDLAHRLNPSHFMFGDQVTNDPKFSEQLAAANQYLAALQLVEAGYHPRDLEVHFHLGKDDLCDRLRYKSRPDLVRLAANVPDAVPNPDCCWLPTITDASNLPARYIQAPPTINDYKDLLPVLDALPTPSAPDHYLTRQLQEFGPSPQLLQKWAEQFGPVHTTGEKLCALAYLVGTTLSDGTIVRQSAFSSTYHMELSTKYAWSKGFGDRAAYYLTSLGIPTKPGPTIEANLNQPHDHFQWWSISNPFLTWFKETALGLRLGETHTYTPARISWVLEAPKAFQVKVLQGLFDGDGYAIPKSGFLGIRNEQNAYLIHHLLERVGVASTTNPNERDLVRIPLRTGFRAAVELPIFLSAKGRQEKAQKILEMSTQGRKPVSAAIGLPVADQVWERRLDNSLSCDRTIEAGSRQIRSSAYEQSDRQHFKVRREKPENK